MSQFSKRIKPPLVAGNPSQAWLVLPERPEGVGKRLLQVVQSCEEPVGERSTKFSKPPLGGVELRAVGREEQGLGVLRPKNLAAAVAARLVHHEQEMVVGVRGFEVFEEEL